MKSLYHNPQTIRNYIYAVVGVAITLYLMGVGGMYHISTNALATAMYEQIPFTIELKPDANDATVYAYQEELKQQTAILPQSLKYISKETGFKNLHQELLQGASAADSLALAGLANPLPNVLQFNIRASHFDHYEALLTEIRQKPFVADVWYAEHLVASQANSFRTTIQWFEQKGITLLLGALLFSFVAFALIKNTLKLLFVDNREYIRTLQLLGATTDFIAKPYLLQSWRNGAISVAAALVMLWITQALRSEPIYQQDNSLSFVLLYSGIVVVGLGLSVGATRWRVRQYIQNAPLLTDTVE